MAVVQNIDFDPSTLVTIDDAILNSIPKRYGRIAESGLFTEEGIVTDTYGFRYNDEDVSVMTGTKSRLGREADRVNTGKQKRAYLSGITFKQEGAIISDLPHKLYQKQGRIYQNRKVRSEPPVHFVVHPP